MERKVVARWQRPTADSPGCRSGVVRRWESTSTPPPTGSSRFPTAAATAFAAGDFRLPGFVHAREVPGTRVMAAGRSKIRYGVESLPRGAALRLSTSDPATREAIHQFLAFQRMDHRAGMGHGQ